MSCSIFCNEGLPQKLLLRNLHNVHNKNMRIGVICSWKVRGRKPQWPNPRCVCKVLASLGHCRNASKTCSGCMGVQDYVRSFRCLDVQGGPFGERSEPTCIVNLPAVRLCMCLGRSNVQRLRLFRLSRCVCCPGVRFLMLFKLTLLGYFGCVAVWVVKVFRSFK